MSDNVYCYPDSDVLINKLNIKDQRMLFTAEKELTSLRLQELRQNPLIGKFDFQHRKDGLERLELLKLVKEIYFAQHLVFKVMGKQFLINIISSVAVIKIIKIIS